MKALVLACEMLGERICRHASRWPHSRRILFLGGEERFLENLRRCGKESRRLPSSAFQEAAPSLNDFLALQFLEMELHRDPELLKIRVLEAARRGAPHVDTLLLTYGGCGNPYSTEAEARRDLGIPVVFPLEEADLADDCIALEMGVRRYRESLKEDPGTFYLTPEWAVHWRSFFTRGGGGKDLEGMEGVGESLRRCGIHRVLKIETECSDRAAFEAGVRSFAETFGLQIDETPGDDRILERAFDRLARLEREGA
jgi:hypothetical protein